MKRQRGDDSEVDNCGLEHKASQRLVEDLDDVGIDGIVLNDFTRADIVVRSRSCTGHLWMKVQVKVTRSHVSKKPNVWQHDHIKGYKGMLVVCLVDDDEDRVWLFDGSYLDGIKPPNVGITPGGKHEKAALSYGSRKSVLLKIAECYQLSHYWASRVVCSPAIASPSTPSLTWTPSETFGIVPFEDCETDFVSDAHAKEFKLISSWTSTVAHPRGWFVDDAGGSSLVYDKMISKDGGNKWLKIQFKSTSPREGMSGFRGKLSKSAGMLGTSKKQRRPYASGDADEYIFIHHCALRGILDVWTIGEAELDGSHPGRTQCITNGKVSGTGTINLHLQQDVADPLHDNVHKGKRNKHHSTIWTAQFHERFECV